MANLKKHIYTKMFGRALRTCVTCTTLARSARDPMGTPCQPSERDFAGLHAVGNF